MVHGASKQSDVRRDSIMISSTNKEVGWVKKWFNLRGQDEE